MKRLLFVLAALTAIAPASAQESDTRWIKKATGRAWVCNQWTGFCQWEYRYGWVRVPSYQHYYRPHYGTQVYGYVQRESVDKAPRCHNGKISAVGIEAFDKAKAKERAESAWAEIVRAKVAGRYMQISNAEAVVYECWKSSTGNRVSEKAAEEFGRELHQCAVEGVPCRSAQDVSDNDDPKTDAMIQRLRAMGYDVRLTEPSNPDEPKKPRIIRRFFKKE